MVVVVVVAEAGGRNISFTSRGGGSRLTKKKHLGNNLVSDGHFFNCFCLAKPK